jgi:hypothetical protein
VSECGVWVCECVCVWVCLWVCEGLCVVCECASVCVLWVCVCECVYVSVWCVCVCGVSVCVSCQHQYTSFRERPFIFRIFKEGNIPKLWKPLLVLHTSPSVVRILLCDETGRNSLINLFIFAVIKFLLQQYVHYCGTRCNVCCVIGNWYCVMCSM